MYCIHSGQLSSSLFEPTYLLDEMFECSGVLMFFLCGKYKIMLKWCEIELEQGKGDITYKYMQ